MPHPYSNSVLTHNNRESWLLEMPFIDLVECTSPSNSSLFKNLFSSYLEEILTKINILDEHFNDEIKTYDDLCSEFGRKLADTAIGKTYMIRDYIKDIGECPDLPKLEHRGNIFCNFKYLGYGQDSKVIFTIEKLRR